MISTKIKSFKEILNENGITDECINDDEQISKLLVEYLTQFIQAYPGGYEKSYDSTKRFAVNKFLKDRIKELKGKKEE